MDKEILDFFEGDELAANVWYDKYAMKDDNGELIDLTLSISIGNEKYDAQIVEM